MYLFREGKALQRKHGLYQSKNNNALQNYYDVRMKNRVYLNHGCGESKSDKVAIFYLALGQLDDFSRISGK